MKFYKHDFVHKEVAEDDSSLLVPSLKGTAHALVSGRAGQAGRARAQCSRAYNLLWPAEAARVHRECCGHAAQGRPPVPWMPRRAVRRLASTARGVESVVRCLLNRQTVVKDYKKIFIQKIGSKNDNFPKASLSLLSLCGTTLKKSSAGWLTAAFGSQVVTGIVESMLTAAA